MNRASLIEKASHIVTRYGIAWEGDAATVARAFRQTFPNDTAGLTDVEVFVVAQEGMSKARALRDAQRSERRDLLSHFSEPSRRIQPMAAHARHPK